MRIGIATGFCTVGNFGSDLRLEYTPWAQALIPRHDWKPPLTMATS